MSDTIGIVPYCDGWFYAGCMEIGDEEYFFDVDEFDDDNPLTYGRVRKLGIWDALFDEPDDGSMADADRVKVEGARNNYTGECYVSGPFRPEIMGRLERAINEAHRMKDEAEAERRKNSMDNRLKL